MVSPDSLQQLQPTHAVFYTNDVVIKKHSLTPAHKRAKRQEITLFSKASQRRLLHVARNSGHFIKSQLCLTYHFALPDDGKKVKAQLNSFLTLLREEYPNIKYLWVLEFQSRGVPHFHLFTDICPSRVSFRDWCAVTWNRILGDSEQHLAFQGHAKNFIPWSMASGRYLVKEYLAKASQKEIPQEYHSVGRFWGNSRNMIPVSQVIEPGVDCSTSAFTKAVRIVSKRREKFLKDIFRKNKIKAKKNYRAFSISYTLPHLTDLFIHLIHFFEQQEVTNDFNRYLRVPSNGCLVWG